MPKTITMRVDDDVYEQFRSAASGTHRSLSSFLEHATLSYLTSDSFVDDDEMAEILSDKPLLRALKQGQKDVMDGRFHVVE